MENRSAAPGARLRRTLEKNPRLAEQALDGKTVVLHYEGRRVLGLNRTGSLIWSLIDGRRSNDDLVAAAAERLQVPATEAEPFEAAVLDFLDELQRKEILVTAEACNDGSALGSAAWTDSTTARTGERG